VRIGRWSSTKGWCLLLAGVACSNEASAPEPPRTRQECLAKAQFGLPATSPYCLPWAEGATYSVSQSYCSPPPGSHQIRFAYDFLMPLGTEVLASRAGRVVELREHWSDDDRTGGHENMVSLRHDDETISIYMHFRRDGVLVEMGDYVPQGGLLGWSGSSGDTEGIPHLHFQICLRSGFCSYLTGEYTMPVNFRNAAGVLDGAGGLMNGESYTALTCR
jgi:murein DD-endopeptidase MepM/ murein hydrolase activator NlpD